jgi:hypothetical protein
MIMAHETDCCSTNTEARSGAWRGFLFGLIPHTVCLSFLVFSVLGATGAMVVAKELLMVPHLFVWVFLSSSGFAAVASLLYLRKTKMLSWRGAASKWKYLASVFVATIATNLFFIQILFPAAVNLQRPTEAMAADLAEVTLVAEIPCTGHAALIIDEVKNDPGVADVLFRSPGVFVIRFDAAATSPEQIRNLEIFQAFPLRD